MNRVILYPAFLFLATFFLLSCKNGNGFGNLADRAIGNTDDYESSAVNAIEQARPQIMVVPGDHTLQNFNCLQVMNLRGSDYSIRDYRQYLLKDDRAIRIISFIQDAFIAKDYPLNDFDRTLKQLETNESLDSADGLEKDIKTMLLNTARPDILIEYNYDTSRDKISMNSHNYTNKGVKNINYTITAYDSYTNKVLATISASNLKGESTTEAINASIKKNMPGFQRDIIKYFSDILTRGRDVTVRIAVEKGANVKLSDTSIEGDTYADWVIDFIKTHTVKGAYKMQNNTDYELSFVNCRIRLLNDDGTQFSVYDWTRELAQSLQKNLGLKVTNKAQGLGEVFLVIQGQ